MSAAARATGERLLLLDLMRGVAALAVVVHHVGLQLGGPIVAPGGYLAVDFFFLLSGFVIAHAYEARLRAALRLREFLLIRLVRLYPLHLLGLALAWRPAESFGGALDPARLMASVLLNAAMLPTPVAHQLFPFNLPAWSLFLELAVNILFAAVLFRWRTRALWLLVAAGAIAMVLGGWWLGSLAGGFNRSTALVGAARRLFSFTLGLVLSRVTPAQTRSVSWWRAVIVILALLAPLIWPVPVGSAWRAVVDLGAVLLLFPAVLVIAARTRPPVALALTSKIAGDLSYPLYAVHSPMLAFAVGVGDLLGINGWPFRVAALLIALGTAWAAMRWWDTPVRRFVSRQLRTREAARPRALA